MSVGCSGGYLSLDVVGDVVGEVVGEVVGGLVLFRLSRFRTRDGCRGWCQGFESFVSDGSNVGAFVSSCRLFGLCCREQK